MVRTVLTEREIGRVQGLFSGRKTTIAQVARVTGRSWCAVAAAMHASDVPQPCHTKRAPSTLVKRRRAAVQRLAKETILRGGKEYPLYCSASAIWKALPPSLKPKTARSVNYDLHELGFEPRVRRKDPSRDPAVLRRRLLWARGLLRQRSFSSFARTIVFSDEHTVSVNDHTSRTMWVRPEDAVIPRERQRLTNIPRAMLWAAVGHGFKSNLVVFPQGPGGHGRLTFRLDSNTYKRRCLAPVVPQLVRNNRVFQQDGASPHGRNAEGSAIVEYLRRKGVQLLLPWPAHSPDANMIERVWPLLNKRIAEQHPTTLDELTAAAHAAWASISQSEINATCEGFESQLRRIVASGGQYA